MSDNEKLTLFIAGYAAIVSTLVFFWDVYKWKTSGVKLEATGQTGMMMLGDPTLEGEKLITIKVVNKGDAPTTITGMGLYVYKNRWHSVYRRNKPIQSFIVPKPNDGNVPPIKLGPGDQWMGWARQTDALLQTIRDQYVMVVAFSTVGNDAMAHLLPNVAPVNSEKDS